MDDLKAFTGTLQDLSEESWGAVREIFRPSQLEKGAWFAVAGEHASRLAFLRSGVLRAYYQSPTGQDYNKAFFVAPAIFGAYSSLITGELNQIHIQALSHCELLEADYADLVALYAEHREVERMARRLAEMKFVEKEQREIDLVILDAKARYLRFRERQPKLEMEIPQYHIASYLGVTPTQLSRIRAELAKEEP